jgi:hypothetical protein
MVSKLDDATPRRKPDNYSSPGSPSMIPVSILALWKGKKGKLAHGE